MGRHLDHTVPVFMYNGELSRRRYLSPTPATIASLIAMMVVSSNLQGRGSTKTPMPVAVSRRQSRVLPPRKLWAGLERLANRSLLCHTVYPKHSDHSTLLGIVVTQNCSARQPCKYKGFINARRFPIDRFFF